MMAWASVFPPMKCNAFLQLRLFVNVARGAFNTILMTKDNPLASFNQVFIKHEHTKTWKCPELTIWISRGQYYKLIME